MARLIDTGFWDQLWTGIETSPDDWPTLAESDQWDEWMKGGTWVAKKGEDFTGSAEEFVYGTQRRAMAADLGWDNVWWPSEVIFRFRYFPAAERDLTFSKPLPAHDEVTGEYLGYWRLPDGTRIELPANVSLTMNDAT
ncbi:hypothetical protein ACWZEH_26195 [Streptomyces sp. QTS137]